MTRKKRTNRIEKRRTKELKNEKTKGQVKNRVQKSKGIKVKGHTSIKKKKIFFLLSFVFLFLGFSVWLFWGLPWPGNLTSNQVPVSTKLFDRNGNLLYEIYTDTRRDPINIKDLPPYVSQATLSIEDKDFYKHHGISISGMVRAAYKTLSGQRLEGGSTLTQQLVKNSLLTPERTVVRKIREIVLTFGVEIVYSKDEILTLYLNEIPYGSTAYGIGAASELYFNKPAKDLTLSEATLLAGLTAAPTKYSPFGAHPEYAKERQKNVLSRMVEDGYITQEEADNTLNEELKFANPQPLKAPHFSLWIKELLAEKYGDSVVEQGGLRVTTTLDLKTQELAENSVATEVAKLKKYNVGNGAALVTKPGTGEILAMVGSKNYFATDEDGKVNIIFAERQPGSSIKPLNYALGLKNKIITLATPFADVPTCFLVFGQSSYCPVNYDGNYHGPVSVRLSLANSYNIPAVRTLALNGVDSFIDFAKDMGISSWTDKSKYGLSLTLGGGEVKPIDMATAFGVFANQGVKVPLSPILKVENWKGDILEDNTDKIADGGRIMDPEIPFLISHALSDNNARANAFGTSSQLVVKGHPEVSVKTGTTNELRDNWTIGYTSHILVLTWVGNNDNKPMSRAVSGVSGASPIWNQIMKYGQDQAEAGNYGYSKDKGHPNLKQPDGIQGANVCSITGNLPDNPDSPGCETKYEYFLKENIGAHIDSGNKDVLIEKITQSLAAPDLPADQIETQNRKYLIDPLGTLVCLDCIIPTWQVRIGYPLISYKKAR